MSDDLPITLNGANFERPEWSTRDVIVVDRTTEEAIFQRKNMYFPDQWSQDACALVAQRFCLADRQTAFGTLLDRLTSMVAHQGLRSGYFESTDEAEEFRIALDEVLVGQVATFDTQVWRTVSAVDSMQLVNNGDEAIVQYDNIDDFLKKSTSANGSVVVPPRTAGSIWSSNSVWVGEYRETKPAITATINLHAFLRSDDSFDIAACKRTIELLVIAQDILIECIAYPDKLQEKEAKASRRIALGFTNLGGFLLAQGFAYSSVAARAQTGAIMALLAGQAYATSARIAQKIGPFASFYKNHDELLQTVNGRQEAVRQLDATSVAKELLNAAMTAWDEAVKLSGRHGLRNRTIVGAVSENAVSMMMDCDTADVEPIAGLVHESLDEKGHYVSDIIPTAVQALKALGYTGNEANAICDHIQMHATLDGAPYLKSADAIVFDTSVSYQDQLKMLIAVRPFVDAKSYRLLLPETILFEDVERAYKEICELDIELLIIEWAKKPSTNTKQEETEPMPVTATEVLNQKSEPTVSVKVGRHILPRRRNSKTYEFRIADLEGFFTVGEYEDGTLGELFVNLTKGDATLSGVLQAFAVSVGYGLQYGVPLKEYVRTMTGTNFAPAGETDDEEVPTVTSLIDYIFRRLALDYLSFDDRLELGLASESALLDVQQSML